MSKANWKLVLVAAMLDVFLLYFRVFKWRFFYGAYKKISFYNMSLAAFAAYTCNTVMPARIGGFVQAWLLGKKESISKSTALGTVALIRVMDGVTLAVVGVIVILFMQVPPEKIVFLESFKKPVFAFAFLALSVISVLVVLRKNEKFEEIFTRSALFISPARYKPRIQRFVKLFWDGFVVLDKSHYFLLIFFLSLMFWGLVATSIFIFLKAFNVNNISIAMPFFILLAQMVGFMVPAPGHIGPYHAATISALSVYGVVGDLALSIAIVMHAVMFLTNALPGLIYLWFENIKLTTITREAKVDLGGSI